MLIAGYDTWYDKYKDDVYELYKIMERISSRNGKTYHSKISFADFSLWVYMHSR